MKVDRRGQITIPKNIRDQFGIGLGTEVEFRVVSGSIIIKKALKTLHLAKWKGHCSDSFTLLGYSSIDQFIDQIRGR